MEITNSGPTATSDSSSSAPPRERSATLWFDDGNVVLRTRTKQYRVHRGVLGSHSSVFRDMFGVPQPQSQEFVNGCPVVDVTDSAHDWDILLGVMYGKEDMISPELGVLPFETLRAALVLGSKYEFERYKVKALNHLERLFPISLEDWDASSGTRAKDLYSSRRIELLELVVSFGYRKMLPAAYYLCIAEVGVEEIIREYRQKRDRPLPFDSLDLLIQGQWRMANALRNNIFRWCWDGTIPTMGCLYRAHCSPLLFPFFREKNPPPSLPDPLQSSYEPINLCHSCKGVAAEELSKGRQATWLQLPGFFDLEDWDSLHE